MMGSLRRAVRGLRRAVHGLKGNGGVVALALLVCGMLFAAVAGPAESLHSRTDALRQTIGRLGATTDAVQATGQLGTVGNDVNGLNGGTVTGALTGAELDELKDSIALGLSGTPLPLSAGDWAGVSTAAQEFSGYGPQAFTDLPPRVLFEYRDTLTSNAKLVAGRFTPGPGFPDGALAVSATPQTAARFGLHPGSRLTVDSRLVIIVTGIVRPAGLASTFWQYDPTIVQPSLSGKNPIWVGGLLVDPGQLGTMSGMFGSISTVNWEFPLSLAHVNADQAQVFYNHLNDAVSGSPNLAGAGQDAEDDITLGTPLLSPLQTFLETQTAVLAVLQLLFVSLIAVGAAVLLLAARMVVDGREDELVMLRARGASARQVAILLARAAALATIPAAVTGVLVALAAVPGAGTGAAVLSWVLGVITVVLAIAAPAVIAAWRHRRPAPAANPARIMTAEVRTARLSPRVLRRLVVEVTAAGGAIAGLAVLRGQGVPAAGGTNWFLTLAPVLAAIPAVLIMLRIYPLIIKVLLAVARRRAGATSYVALAASARTSLASTGPAFALVLALTLTAFAGMVTEGISAAQAAASWQTTGADAAIAPLGEGSLPVAALHAVSGVRGVQHAAEVWTEAWNAPSGQQITAVAVNPAQYSALTAATPFPAIAPGTLTTSSRPVTSSTTIDVLASPAAAAALGAGTAQLTSINLMGPIRVHITAIIAATPAEPGGGTFILMPLQTLPGPGGQPAPTRILLSGTGIDRAQLATAIKAILPGDIISYRADALNALTSSPLQHGAVTLMLLTAIAAAAFGLLNLILGLALGAADRDLTLARLAVMGDPHRNKLAMTEALPAVLAAAAAGLVCALTLPVLIGSALNLSVFTSSSSTVTLKPDITSIGLPVAALLILAAATLAVQTRIAHHRGPTGLLRAN
jgi:putative ABC transport system permease protein